MIIETSIIIQADAATVWKHLIDMKAYPEWNPFLNYLGGEIRKGNKIQIEAGGMKFSPTLLAVTENKKLEWIGRLGFKGIFDGTHSFELNETSNGYTEFIHKEHFSGLLVPVFKKKLDVDTRQGFEKMNEALKERAEKG